MTRPQIPIEPIRDALRVLAEFNQLDLRDVVLTEAGRPIAVTTDDLQDFRFAGLSNKSFVEMEWWTRPSEYRS